MLTRYPVISKKAGIKKANMELLTLGYKFPKFTI
jgi:hypothetical protein